MAKPAVEESFEGRWNGISGVNSFPLYRREQFDTPAYVVVHHFHQEATVMTTALAHRIRGAARSAEIEMSVGQEISRCVLPLTTPRESGAARLQVAYVLYEAIGDDLLADDVEITLNGTSLTGELIDVACQPRFSYAT